MFLEAGTLLNLIYMDQRTAGLDVLYYRHLILFAMIQTDPEVFPLRKLI